MAHRLMKRQVYLYIGRTWSKDKTNTRIESCWAHSTWSSEAAGNWQTFNCFVWFRDSLKSRQWAIIYQEEALLSLTCTSGTVDFFRLNPPVLVYRQRNRKWRRKT